jgi:SET domain-containing protein
MTMQNRDFVRVGRSKIEGRGVFAKRKIPLGSRIIEYTGARVTPADLLAPGARIYSFRLDDGTIVDGTRGGNDSRFINHSCAPNCEAYVFDGRIYIYAMRDIVRGEELSFDYQLSPADAKAASTASAPALSCRCGAQNCRGTMRRILPEDSAIKSPKPRHRDGAPVAEPQRRSA